VCYRPANVTDPEHHSIGPGVVLWERGAIRCTCRLLATSEVEILVSVSGADIERVRFTDAGAAAEYAIAKMRAYDAH
jgi:hypothetical protein